MKMILKRTAALVVGLMLGAGAWAGLETVTHISDLNSSWPLGSDLASTSDDHIRNIKVALKTDFPNITGPVTATQVQINAAVAFLSSANTWSAQNIFSKSISTVGTASDAPIKLSSSQPGIALVNTSGAADAKSWNVTVTTTDLLLQYSPDAGGSTKNLLDFTRSGNTASAVAFGNATDNPAYSFLGSGVGSFAGSLGVGTAGSVAKFAVASTSGVGGGPGTAWTSAYSLFGPNVGSTTGAALGLAYDSTADSGVIISLAPNVAWKPVTISASALTYKPSGGTAVDLTPDTGTFTATMTGGTTSPTCTARWTRVGNLVMLELCSATATSNATTFTYTGLPAAVQPTVGQNVPMAIALDNGAAVPLITAQLAAASGTITFFKSASSTGWTNVGSKGLNVVNTISYLLN